MIGGAQIYEAALEQAERIYFTRVDTNPIGDAYFPELDGRDGEDQRTDAKADEPATRFWSTHVRALDARGTAKLFTPESAAVSSHSQTVHVTKTRCELFEITHFICLHHSPGLDFIGITGPEQSLVQIDGLKVYNARLERQIDNQERRIARSTSPSIDVTVIQRQMTPLVIRMIDGLEQFVELDVPFHIDERRQRIAFLRNNLDRSDVTVAEKFRQVLEAYKIENEYGRKIDAYKGSVEIDGVERDVNFFRVGRIALLYQTTDTEVSGAWDKASRSWVQLDSGEYAQRHHERPAHRPQGSIYRPSQLPVAAPEAAE